MRCLGTALLLALAGCASSTVIDESKIVDLTWSFDENTVYWPTADRFRLERVAWGPNEDGDWYASNNYSASEHGGTHLDAPIHFHPDRLTTAEIPIQQLVGPVHVIDITRQCGTDSTYLLQPSDLERHESQYGPIRPGDIVLIHTGFGRYYPDLQRYLGSEVRGRVEGLRFPGIGEAAAHALVDRKIAMVGLDTASLDHGPSTHFDAHRVLCAADIPGLENVAHLERLPPTGATLIALPMKIAGGTGGPCRIIAILP